MFPKIPYKSFCWVIGTTSFRTAQLNLKTEQQLLLLSQFQRNYTSWQWTNNAELQEDYYNYLQENQFVKGEANNKPKDAREKTSGLVDIGLLTKDRQLTEVSRLLLNTEQLISKEENLFYIDKDSYIYLLQLLKTSLSIDDKVVRSYIILAKYLNKFDYLSFDEFRYVLPITNSEKDFEELCKEIQKLRENKITINDILFNHLMTFDNYKKAKELFLTHSVSEDLVCTIGMNRKSKQYDKPYFVLYELLYAIFIEKKDVTLDLLNAINKLNQTKSEWKKLIFKNSIRSYIVKNKLNAIQEDNPFANCQNEQEFKEIFFKYLHLFKAIATLKDYFDLNRRYLSLTDTLLFDEQSVKFDVVPKYFFKLYQNYLDNIAFTQSSELDQFVTVENILDIKEIDIEKLYALISKELGITFNSPQQLNQYVQDERHQRFNQLIKKKFTDNILIELLNCFESRNDDRIRELVTDNAEIYSIFEYIIGIIWYKVSEQKGNILDYMQLSLDAQLLPKSHAQGGGADIIYQYDACEFYPKHTLLIEPTLADGNNQRRMEMEPVSRHLGDYRLKYKNPYDYSLFVSTFLHKNVVSDFRYRKNMPYFGKDDEMIDGLKIISLDTKNLKNILQNQMFYSKLYRIFEKYHQQDLTVSIQDWQQNLIEEATGSYLIK